MAVDCREKTEVLDLLVRCIIIIAKAWYTEASGCRQIQSRLLKFLLSSDGQRYAVSRASTLTNERMAAYLILRPLDYIGNTTTIPLK